MDSALMTLKAILYTAVMITAASVPAYALGAKATFANGVVTVSGGQAAKSAPITWEGAVVATANKGGSFAFVTPVIPSDCTGTLSDGMSTIQVRVEGCGGGSVSTLPGTGQTISYAPGDDAAVRAGGALSYRDNGDGTVTDLKTGLTWEKKTDANVNGVYSWQAALDYAAELNAMNGGVGFAGHSDWRVPNVKELLSILDYGRSNPSIDPIFGPTIGILNYVTYWTSTSWAAFYPQYNAWGVEFNDAYGNNIGALAFGKSSALRVRLVRGGL